MKAPKSIPLPHPHRELERPGLIEQTEQKEPLRERGNAILNL